MVVTGLQTYLIEIFSPMLSKLYFYRNKFISDSIWTILHMYNISMNTIRDSDYYLRDVYKYMKYSIWTILHMYNISMNTRRDVYKYIKGIIMIASLGL
jgi:heme O synthase-like polyprenyltransferase